jgi:Asp-tRNA(Asn)/Glu-tRNA(Gln) amidotransferase C subunit
LSVTPDDVRGIAALAHLVLPDDEIRRMTRELNAILEHVAALPAAEEVRDTGAPVGPASAPERRPGDIEPDPLRQPPESFAPDLRDGLFLVPKLSVLHDDPAGGSGR